jgi:sn-glycerol 3-phosphate transport system substrate-binding protein
MNMRRTLLVVLSALTAPIIAVFAACGGGDGGGFSDECPIGLVDEESGPVRVVFWHAMTAANRDTLERMVSEFNASQDRVIVEPVFQGTYDDNLAKYFTALRGDTLPDIIQIEDTGAQRMIDSRTVVRAQDCITAEQYDLSDYLERVIAYYSINGELWPYPFNVSNPVLYYNRTAFERAGLDPDRPPATLDEIRTVSQQLVDSGVVRHGIALELGGWFFEQWLAKAGEPFVDNDNGRTARATSVLFDSDTGRELFRWIDGMVDDGLAVSVGRNPSGADTLLAVGSGDAAMTIGTSAAMRSVFGVLESGQFPDVTVGVGPMPGLVAEDRGGIEVGGAALFVINRSSAIEEEASRIFVRWLNEPAQQAEWHVGSGYIPIRKSATELQAVQDLWAELPHFRVAYDQLLAGETNAASAGTVLGAYEGVREALVTAMEQMLLEGKHPDAALADAADASNTAIEEYNDRIR